MKDYINLIPAELEKRGRLSKEIIIALGIAGVFVIFGVLYGTLFSKVRTLKAEKGQLTIKRDNISKELSIMLSEINSLTAKTGSVKDKGSAPLNLKDALKGKITWSPVLREVSFLVSADIWLTTIESRKKKDTEMKEIRFMGNASSHADLTNFIAALERSDSFANVSLSYAQQGESSGRTVINFEIISDLKKAS